MPEKETLTTTLCKSAKMRSKVATVNRFVAIVALLILGDKLYESAIGTFGLVDAIVMLAVCAQLAMIYFYGLTRKYAEDRVCLSLAYSLVFALTMLRIKHYKDGDKKVDTTEYKAINDLSDFCVRIGRHRGQLKTPHVESVGWHTWISYQQEELQPTQQDLEILLRAMATDLDHAETYLLIIALMSEAVKRQTAKKNIRKEV